MPSDISISFVMSNYNHGHYIGEALESIICQSYLPVEILIIDDASTDNSVEVIQQFQRRCPLIKLFKNKINNGVVENVEKLIGMSSGDYIMSLSADDKCLPGFLIKSAELLKQYPDAGLCCTNPFYFNDAGGYREIHLLWSDRPGYFSPENFSGIINGGFIYGHTSIFNKNKLIKCGGFDRELRWHCDWFTSLVMAFRHGVCYLPEGLSAMRENINTYSTAGRRDWKQQKEVLLKIFRDIKSASYNDILPHFINSSVMSVFGEESVRVILEQPEILDNETLMLMQRPLNDWLQRMNQDDRAAQINIVKNVMQNNYDRLRCDAKASYMGGYYDDAFDKFNMLIDKFSEVEAGYVSQYASANILPIIGITKDPELSVNKSLSNISELHELFGRFLPPIANRCAETFEKPFPRGEATMSVVEPEAQTLRDNLESNKLNEVMAKASTLLTTNNESQADILTVVDVLLESNQLDFAIALARKAFLTDPFDDTFWGWLETANLSLEYRNFLVNYASTGRRHFERVLNTIGELGPLIFVDLGASSSDHFQVPSWLYSQCHMISLDGVSVPDDGVDNCRRTSIKSIVAGQSGPAVFYEKHWLAASSLLPDIPEVISAFGMERFTTVKTEHAVTTRTLTELLHENGITRIDALKTDLEGIDLDVIRSIELLLPSLNFLRMELAFLPRYQGEPYFHDAHQFLVDRGFTLMGVKPEFWRYKTEHRDYESKGRAIWGDFEYLANKSTSDDINELVRHVVVAAVSDYKNYAEYLVENKLQRLNAEMSQSLKFVIFEESAILKPKHVNSQFPHIGTD